MSDKPRIDRVVTTYYRKGKCKCGKVAERARTFQGPTLERCQEQADEWMQEPIRHRRCEGT